MWILALVKGIGLGLLVALLVGPVFFALIGLAIEKGSKPAIVMALGISASDGFYIILSCLGLFQLNQDATLLQNMGWFGSALLCTMGLFLLFKKGKLPVNTSVEPQKAGFRYFIKGFALNAINPSVVLFWFTMAGMMAVQFKQNSTLLGIFFGASLATIFGTDLLKIYASQKLLPWITAKTLRRLNIFSGLILVVYGLKMLWDVVYPSS